MHKGCDELINKLIKNKNHKLSEKEGKSRLTLFFKLIEDVDINEKLIPVKNEVKTILKENINHSLVIMIIELLLFIEESLNEIIINKEKKLIEENGFKIIRTFLYEGRNITVSNYYRLLYEYSIKLIEEKPIYLEHVSYVWSITDSLFMFSDMTKQHQIKTKESIIPCIKLEDNIFKYTTPMFIADQFMLQNFIKIVNSKTNTPQYLFKYNANQIIDSIQNAVYESYKYSNSTYHTFYNMTLSNIKNQTFEFNKLNDILISINNQCPCDLVQLNEFKNELDEFIEKGFNENRKNGIRVALPNNILDNI